MTVKQAQCLLLYLGYSTRPTGWGRRLEDHSWDVDILLQGVIGSLIVTFFEFVIGSLFLKGYLPVMWDYSNLWMNYKGIICLPFSLVWIVLSIMAVIVADAINYYMLGDEDVPYYKLFGKTILKFKAK